MKDFPNSHSGLLEQIIQNKQSEVAAAKLEVSTSELIDKCASISPPISLRDAIANRSRPENDQKQATVALIAEVKSASPSAGLISRSFDPLSLAENYAKSGAGAISVLTDKKYFNGNNSYLEAIRKKVSFPILRKDFIIDRYQLFESRSLGADAILLIVAALPPALLSELFLEATELGMDVLVEVHDHLELEQALSALRSIPILGINNRDLRTFEVDLDTTSRLLKDVPDYSMLVSESGIQNVADIERVAASGADAVLVGEALVRAEATSQQLRPFSMVPRQAERLIRERADKR